MRNGCLLLKPMCAMKVRCRFACVAAQSLVEWERRFLLLSVNFDGLTGNEVLNAKVKPDFRSFFLKGGIQE